VGNLDLDSFNGIVFHVLRIFLISIVGLLSMGALQAENEDFVQIWNRVSVQNFKYDQISMATSAQLRGRDTYSRIQRWHVTQSARYHWHKYASIGLGFSIFQDNIPDDPDGQLEYRLFPDLSHSIPLNDHGLSVKIRNRIDIRFREHEDHPRERSRHLIGLHYDIPENWGSLDYLFASNELFYDWRKGEINQYRVTPFGLGFLLNEHLTLESYYMLRIDENGSPWDRMHVLGSHLKVKF